MAINLTVTESYCTLAEADLYLETNSTWQAETNDDIKTKALLVSRYYIEMAFNCDLADLTTIPDELKMGTAYLAVDYINDSTIFDDDLIIQEKEVKAGSLSSRKKYTASKRVPPSLTIVKSIMQNYCTYQGNLVNLMRA